MTSPLVFLLLTIVAFLTYVAQGVSLVMILAHAVVHDAAGIALYAVTFIVMGLLRRDVRSEWEE